MKRFLYTIVLMAGLFGGVSRAYAWSGSGTSSDPYLIGSKADWTYFVGIFPDYVYFKDKYIQLNADISVDGVMTPKLSYFQGTFDGNGHTIKIDVNGQDSYLALFRWTEGATIKNLRVVGSITNNATSSVNNANRFSAGLVGNCCYGTKIQNCVISVTISSAIVGDGSHGGIVGCVSSSANVPVLIENCLFNGKLLGDNTHSCGGFVGAGTNNSQKCKIRNCLFSPSEITMKIDGSSTFSRCSINTDTQDNIPIYSFYTKAFGTTENQGGDVSGTPVSSIPGLLNQANPGVDGTSYPWELNEGGNVAYLYTFNKAVDITGWIAGSTAGTSSTNPYLDIFGGDGVTYEYKVYTAGDETYTTTAPIYAGHYYVRATSPDGFKSKRDFYVYDPPTPKTSLTYNGTDQSLLTVPNIEKGTYYFKVDDGGWGSSTPKGQAARTYTIYYYIKNNYPYNFIGSQELPAGCIEVTIAPKPLGSDAIVLGETTYTYDGTEKKPSVTVKDGTSTVYYEGYTVSYSNNTNAGTATVTVTDNEGGNYVVNGTATFTITPKEVSSPIIEIPATVTYTGSALTPTVTVKDGNTEIPSSEYTVSYSNNVNVGDVPVVTITDNTGGNYTVNGTTTFTIVKAAPTYTAPTSKDPTYNMNVQELINPGSTNHGIFEYSTDGTNFTTSTTGLVGTDAKDYLIYYRIIGDSNHSDVGYDPSPALTLTVTIKPKPVSSPEILLSPDVYYYDGTAKTPAVTVRDEGVVIPSTEYTVDYGNNVNAGNVTVTLTDNPGGNYNVSGTQTFTIVAQAPTVTPPTAISGLIYNTKPQNLLMAGTAVGGTVEYSLDGTTYSTTIPQGQDAKQYPVYYRVKGDANHTDRDPVQLYVTISPKTVSSPTINLDPSSFTYDGTKKEPTVTVKDGETVIPTSEYAVEYSNNVDVGTAMVIITDNTGGNYIVNGSTNFTILSAGSGITPPTAKTDIVYNGENQDLVTEGSASGGTMYYGLSRSSFSTVVPTGREAKTYTVYYKVVGDSNHDDSEVGSVDVTIAPKTLSDPEIVLTPSSFVYDGTSKEPVVTVKDGDIVVPASEYTITYSNNKDVGSGTVTITDNEGGNYNVSGTANFSITNASATVTPPTAKTGLVYNAKPQQLVSEGIVVGGTMEYSLDDKTYSTEVPTGTNAQQYTVFYRVKGDENHGDKEAASLMVTISAKTVSNPIITLGTTSYVYDGKEKTPDVTVKDGENLVDASEYTVTYTDNINVGTAMAVVSDKDGGNYIVNGSKSFSIVNANADVTPPTAKEDLVYNGEEQQLLKAGSVKGGTMEYSLNNASFTTEIPTGLEAKVYKVYYRVKGDSNYSDEEAATLSVTISPKTVDQPTIILTPASFTYDGKEKMPAVTVVDGETTVPSTEYTVSYSDNTAVGTAKVTIADKENGNYTVSGTASFSIVAAVAGVTFPEVKSGLVYNRSAQELITAGKAAGGTMEYSLDGKTYSTSIPTGTDAKEYTVYFKVVGDDNHESMAAQTLVVSISPKALASPVVELSEKSFIFDGTPKEPTVTVKDEDAVVPASEYTIEYTDNVNVGTGKVTVNDKDGGNYVVNTTATFSILMAGTGVMPPEPKTGLVYNGKAQLLITAGSAEGGTMKYSLDKNTFSTEIPTGTDAKQYTVYYMVDGDENHSDSDSGSVDVTISPKTLNEPQIILEPANFIYDGVEKKPTVTVMDGETTVPSTEYTVSYSNNLEAGTATVTVTDNKGGNYTVSGTAQFSIITAVAGVTLPTAISGLVYNGSAQELIVAGSTVGGTMEYSLDNKNYSTKVPTGKDAKQYTVYFKVVGDDNHASMDPVSLTVTISSKSLTSPVIELNPSQFLYDGQAKEPVVTVKDGEVVVPASEYTVSYSNNVNVGTATVTIKDKTGGNYVISATATFRIYDPNSGFVAPVALSGLVYNGNAQELVMAGTGVDGVMKYSLNNKNYSTDIPKATDAGNYRVYYKVVNEENNIERNAGSVSVTISPKTTVLSVTIQGAPESVPTVKVNDPQGNLLSSDDYTYEITDSKGHMVTPVGNHLDAGDYVITVTPAGNYTGPSVSTSFHVRRAYTFVFTMHSDLIGVCLPYNRDVPNGYHVYYFDRKGADGNPVFKRILLDKLSGGEPYLLRYVGSSSSTRAERVVDLSPSSPGLIDLSIQIRSTVNQNMVFTGTFDDMTNTKGLSEGAYLLQPDHTWKPLDRSAASDGDGICLEAFSAYIRYKDRTTPEPSLSTTLEPKRSDDPDDPDNPDTGFNAFILEDENGHQEWFDLNGRRIEAPQKGVNILRTEDGKTRKVVIR